MSARPITKSQAKLQRWADTVRLDRLAKEIAEREGCALVEAYPAAIDKLEHTPMREVRETLYDATID